ncbi:MAG TPA: hypothetical protein VMB73_25575 [Acetobacteraceae bacterium]|nr:hypothetical protein [Acetobacteraceae bacterium]
MKVNRRGAVCADTPDNPSRRAILVGSTAALLAGAAIATAAHGAPVAPPAGDDAELLALRRSFLVEHDTVTAWNADRVTEEIGEAAHDRWWECVEAMTDIPATTTAGLRAKAEVALLAYEFAGGQGGPDEDLIRSALRDAIAGRAVA